MKMRSYLGVMAALGLLTSVSVPAVEGGDLFRKKKHNMPPAARMMQPGPMVDGPGPAVLAPQTMAVPPEAMGYSAPAVQVLFNQPQSMQLQFDVVGDHTFNSELLVVPGRLEFPQGGIYRVKLTNIRGREGVELYPTLEVAPITPRTAAFIAHNAVPVQFTEEDFEQALSGNFVTKVIYLPDPAFQGDALAGIDTLVSTRLEPGMDPIVEADRRGSILAIIRLGNKDIEMSAPAMSGGYAGGQPGMGMPMMPGGMMCGPDGMPIGMGAGIPPALAGQGPQWGMPHSGTPIGLVGPPHIPLGGPAGLQSHVMRNHTHMWMPEPVSKTVTHVKQSPGYSYPQPASRAHIVERNNAPGFDARRPSMYQGVRSSAGGGVQPGMMGGMVEDCPPEMIR
jgi:hypothetical protein